MVAPLVLPIGYAVLAGLGLTGAGIGLGSFLSGSKPQTQDTDTTETQDNSVSEDIDIPINVDYNQTIDNHVETNDYSNSYQTVNIIDSPLAKVSGNIDEQNITPAVDTKTDFSTAPSLTPTNLMSPRMSNETGQSAKADNSAFMILGIGALAIGAVALINSDFLEDIL